MFILLDPTCTPTKATEFSSCVDLYARVGMPILKGHTACVPLGIQLDRPYMRDHLGQNFMRSHSFELKCRSSLPLKKNLMVANGVGEIDLDFPDEICILLHNVGQETTCVEKGERIAQMKLVPHKGFLMGFDSLKVRTGGFGSTD